MFRLVLISVNNPTILGIYLSDSLIMQSLESKQYTNVEQRSQAKKNITSLATNQRDSLSSYQQQENLDFLTQSHTIDSLTSCDIAKKQNFSVLSPNALQKKDFITTTINGQEKDSISSIESYSLLYSLALDGKTSQTLPLLFAPLLQHHANYFLQSSVNICTNECTMQECQISPLLFLLYQDSKLFAPEISTMLDSVFAPLLESHEVRKTDFLQYNEMRFYNPLFSMQEAVQLLTAFHNIHGIYYARGVGSLSAIKLTHIFLHTLSLSLNIPLYATNSFYFNGYNEIKAFGNMSFFYHGDKGVTLTDSNIHDFVRLQKSIAPHTSFTLPYKLLCTDFNESCTPLYITPAL